MFRLNLQRFQIYFMHGLRSSCRRRPNQLLSIGCAAHGEKAAVGAFTLWRRLISQYQFRVKKEAYYPDRKLEMQRTAVSARQMLAINPQHQQRGLPKDYYYRVLGVNRHATVQQIRSAFYALAKRYHPDSMHSEEKLKHFQELSNAYNILTDETKRLEYDQLGGIKDEKAFLAQAGNPMNIDLNSKRFEAVCQSPEDIKKLTVGEYDLPLSFLEATVGCKKRIDLRYLRKCESCKGKSQLMANRDLGKEPCRRCNGTGKVTTKTLTFTSVNTCSQCKGKRYINRNDCDACDNRGFVTGNVEVLITVPSGSKTGDVITVDNPNTKQRVKYTLQVPQSDYFRRVGNDIHTDKFLNISDAILGGNFLVRGLYDNVELRVEPGTQSHTQVVLHNKGVRTRDGVGNHIITLKVRIPCNLSMKQRQLILALAQSEEPVFEFHKGSKKAKN
ncbi:PREDICTED: dnaJ homolog subfamily A member 3, mitochondrial [Drosophila arizonae]|uniref:DnaJ homolog subfamily A member 3, mitochondrial n=1 Tax=Drosophila arizonae TaxID=7263 RepID=A0ABM1P815_DROAR|nr:PREDICTED: dnaJ homolog subfamily A member 3, mitochondrial [Drosophila arizonae]